MVPITFCTQSDDCTRRGCGSAGCVADANPRSCDSLTTEVGQLIDVVPDALAEASALADIMQVQRPMPEILEAAGEMAVALFLGRRVLLEGLDALQRRHPDRPAYFLGLRMAAEMEWARRALVAALLDEAKHLTA